MSASHVSEEAQIVANGSGSVSHDFSEESGTGNTGWPLLLETPGMQFETKRKTVGCVVFQNVLL